MIWNMQGGQSRQDERLAEGVRGMVICGGKGRTMEKGPRQSMEKMTKAVDVLLYFCPEGAK